MKRAEPNDPKERILERCRKDGEVELTGEQFMRFFPGVPDEMKELWDFQETNGVRLELDKEKQTVKFVRREKRVLNGDPLEL